MNDRIDSSLIVRFMQVHHDTDTSPYVLSRSVPASQVSAVINNLNRLMQATWDYALSHPSDDRFRNVRQVAATGAISRQDVELTIVSARVGSLEVVLDWLIAVLATPLAHEIALGVATNALWDLVKYSFQTLRALTKPDPEPALAEGPLAHALLHPLSELVRIVAAAEHRQFELEFSYIGPDGEMIRFRLTKDDLKQIQELARQRTESPQSAVDIQASNVMGYLAALQKDGALPASTKQLKHQVQERQQTVAEQQAQTASELSRISQLPPAEARQLLEDALTLSIEAQHLERLVKGLEDLSVEPQCMMFTESVLFVFGGKEGEAQQPIHIVDALRENLVECDCRGTGRIAGMEAILKRHPSCQKKRFAVFAPVGTCITLGPSGSIEYPSMVIPQDLANARRVHKD